MAARLTASAVSQHSRMVIGKAGARSLEALVDASAAALAAFTAEDCLNFFAAAGYDHV